MNTPSQEVLDLAIIGAGPAGMAAGIYAGRGGMKAVLLDGMGGGGQVNIIDRVENYPGVMDLDSGAALADLMRRQTEHFGIPVSYDQVERVEIGEDWITLIGGETYRTRTLLVASGARHKPLKVPGEGRLMGKGVSVCATCDGAFFKGRPVAVVGGGDSAVMEAVYLSKIVGKVTLIHRRDKLRAEKVLQDRLLAAGNVEFRWETTVLEILGESEVSGLKLKDVKTGQESTLDVAAVFVFVGIVPNTEMVKGLVELDEGGFIRTDIRMSTSHPRIFAAGDVRSNSVRQIGTAVGDGITATMTIQEFLNTRSLPR